MVKCFVCFVCRNGFSLSVFFVTGVVSSIATVFILRMGFPFVSGCFVGFVFFLFFCFFFVCVSVLFFYNQDDHMKRSSTHTSVSRIVDVVASRTEPTRSTRRRLSPKRLCPTLLVNDRLITCMAMVWMAVILYGESLSFSSHVARCTAKIDSTSFLRPPTEKARTLDQVSRVALVSDPQLTSAYSYDWITQHPVLARVVEFLSDVYMRKAYQAIQTIQRPEVVFFTCDLFDGVTYNLYKQRRCVKATWFLVVFVFCVLNNKKHNCAVWNLAPRSTREC